jgi:RNA polymerase sigma factor (sigma-70 family)
VDASDQELIQQLFSSEVSISEKGWQRVYSSCYTVVSDMVRKNNGSIHDAGDIFHDGLLIFNRNLNNGMFRGQSSIKTYLFKICKNLWLKEYKRKQKQLTAEADAVVMDSNDMYHLINVKTVSLLMNELQDDCRNILIEYYYNNRSMSELMELFNVNSIQAVKNKKWRCKNYLEKLFKEKASVAAWE